MTPARAIEILDRQLDQHGQIIDLIRVTGTTSQTRFSVNIRAWVREYEPKELSEQIIQGDSRVIISPTDLNREGWVGLPRRGDKVIVQNQERNVQSTSPPWYIQGTLVRLELQVRGQQ